MKFDFLMLIAQVGTRLKRTCSFFSCAYAYVACVMLIAQVGTRLYALSLFLALKISQ